MEEKADDESMKARCSKLIYKDAITEKFTIKKPIFNRLIKSFVVFVIFFTCIIIILGWIAFLIDYFIVDDCLRKKLEPAANTGLTFKFNDIKTANLKRCNSPYIFRSGLLASFEIISWLNNIFIILATAILGVTMLLILFTCATYTYVKQKCRVDLI